MVRGGELSQGASALPGTRHLCLKEGNHAVWLHELLAPHVQEIVVAGTGRQTTQTRGLNRNFNHVLMPEGAQLKAA